MMKRKFPLEEETPNPDPFRIPSPPSPLSMFQTQVVDRGVEGSSGDVMNPSLPDWCFLEESLLSIPNPSASNLNVLVLDPDVMMDTSPKRHCIDPEVERVEVIPRPLPSPATASVMQDPAVYNAMLREKLDEDLAAVALLTASRSSQSNTTSNQGSQNYIGDNEILVQQMSGGGQYGGTSPNLAQNPDVSVRQVSSPLREQSPSTNNIEGEAETMGNMNFSAEKVKMRRESNRISARRSRYKKATQMQNLQHQLSLLEAENKYLVKRQADLIQKYSSAVIDNRVLKANVETLETKVKLVEEIIKRFTSTHDVPQVVSSLTSLGFPLSASPSNGAHETFVPTQNTPFNYFTAVTTNGGVNNIYTPEATSTFQIQDPVALLQMQSESSLEHLQRRVCDSAPSSSVLAPQEVTSFNPNEFINMGMQ